MRPRKAIAALTFFAAAGATAVALIGRHLAAPRHRGPATDHFDGKRFHNRNAAPHGTAAFFRWMLTRDRGAWSDRSDALPGPRPESRVGPGALRITFVNHATLLVQIDGVNILTDPIWSDRCSPYAWVGPKRFRPPGVRFEDLPPIDAVILSHNHYDHLDIPTLQRLVSAHNPVILVPLGNGALLSRHDIAEWKELDWNDSSQVGNRVTIHCARATHFSGRGIGDRDANLWSAWVIEAPGGPVYFAGDTGWDSHFEETHSRFGPMRAAMLPIGAFKPEWFMSPVHISPRQAVDAHLALESRRTVPMHYGTFALGDDGETEAIDALRAVIREHGLEREFAILSEGESIDLD